MNTTMLASGIEELLPLPADVEHPSWCNPRQCYRNPETGFPVHEYAPMSVTVNGETIALTVARWDTADGAGETWAYLATTSEEGDVITKRKWAD
jgi:hypothetical protein